MANVYCQCVAGIKDLNVNVLRGISEATDSGHRFVIASGDWNITADELEASGILKASVLKSPDHPTATSRAPPARKAR